MKLLAFSDIHLDAVTAGRSRRTEVLAFLDRTFEIADREKVDLVIFAGDAHDPGSALDSLYTSDLLRRFFVFTQSGKRVTKLVAVAGNHDVVDTSELYLGAPVTTLTPLRAAANALCGPNALERVMVFDRPHVERITEKLVVLGLPYISRAHASKAAEWDAQAIGSAASAVKAGSAVVVVGHRVVPGAQISSESIEMARGQEQIFPIEAVSKLNPMLVINGHYHSRQTVDCGPISIAIPGSPLRFSFGEAAQVSKGVLLAELDI